MSAAPRASALRLARCNPEVCSLPRKAPVWEQIKQIKCETLSLAETLNSALSPSHHCREISPRVSVWTPPRRRFPTLVYSITNHQWCHRALMRGWKVRNPASAQRKTPVRRAAPWSETGFLTQLNRQPGTRRAWDPEEGPNWLLFQFLLLPTILEVGSF